MSRTLVFLVFVPLVAVAVYFCVQPVKVEVEVKNKIRTSPGKVFAFLKNPEVAVDIHNKGLTDLLVLEFTPTVLDEKDGYLKDVHLTQLTQRLPLGFSIRFNTTWKSCAERMQVETFGTVTGYDRFYSLESIQSLASGEVEVTRYNDLLVPRIFTLATQRFTAYQHQILNGLKLTMEKDGVEAGTQTD